MNVSYIEPRVELKPYLRAIWIFESEVGLPASEVSLVAPNGCAKLIVSCENSLVSTAQGRSHLSKEQSLYFVGLRDIPVTLSTPPGRARFLGVEFYPFGAFPVLGIPMAELTNRLFPAEALSAFWTPAFTERLRNTESLEGKVGLIQERLWQSLRQNRPTNPIVEHCVEFLKRRKGLASISELEHATGYDKRYLELLFRTQVGVSPKTLAGIFRFRSLYKKLIAGSSYAGIQGDVYEYYYDQAHFVKDFKKMTGFPPKYFSRNVPNSLWRWHSLM